MYDTTKPYKEQVIKLIARTWHTPYVSVENGISRYKLQQPFIFSHVDGIGTKGIYHWEKRTFKEAVLDALAMNLNDLALQRAFPFEIIDHLFIPEDDNAAIFEIIEALSDECIKRKIAITGGETAIHNNMQGMELSIAMSGYIENQRTNKIVEGDVLIGLASNGLHSSGFTKIRQLFGEEYRKEFTKPTEIYLEKILELDKKYRINGLMHITGGAFTKLKGLLKQCNAEITRGHELELHDIFKEIYSKNVSDEEMYKTFNCGIGFVLSVSQKFTLFALHCLEDMTEFNAAIIGNAVKGTGKVIIESKFSDKLVTY